MFSHASDPKGYERASKRLRKRRAAVQQWRSIADEQCRGLISPQFLRNALITNDYLIQATQKSHVRGFLVARRLYGADAILYIDLICTTNHTGKLLLEHAEQLARRTKINTLALRASSPEVVLWYVRHGFIETANACKRRSTALMRTLNSNKAMQGYWMTKCLQMAPKIQ